jgi:hypothetical protein
MIKLQIPSSKLSSPNDTWTDEKQSKRRCERSQCAKLGNLKVLIETISI